MWFFYLCSLIPLIIGLILFIRHKKVIWQEWLISAACAFLLSGIFHVIAANSNLGDVETWSGKIVMAKKFSAWQEYYQEAIYRTEYYTTTEIYYANGKSRTRTVTKSRRVFSHWEDRTRWHDEHYKMFSNISTDYNIPKEEFYMLMQKFSNMVAVAGKRTTGEHNSKMIAGNKDDYESKPVSGYIYPVTRLVPFENRVKAAPSVFSFVKVPTNMNLPDWPNNPNFRQSDRLIGDAAKRINIFKWDQMNAVLGPLKEVNVIMIGFTNASTMIAQYQEAKWVNGKKNDLVLCYNIDNSNKVTWTRVFSWTEKEICKRNLETLLLTTPINDDILPKISDEILKNFERKDWHKFDYITVEPKPWVYFTFITLLVLSQVGIWIFNIRNDMEKE